jgi:hypothetical protein
MVANVRTRLIFGSTFCNLIPCNYITIFWALQPNVGYGLHIHEVSRSHMTTNHSPQDSYGRVISSSQRPQHDNTQHSQQTDICAPAGIRTHNLSRRVASDLHLRPCGHWDCLLQYLQQQNLQTTIQYVQLVKSSNKNCVTSNEQSICHTQAIKRYAVDYRLRHSSTIKK